MFVAIYYENGKEASFMKRKSAFRQRQTLSHQFYPDSATDVLHVYALHWRQTWERESLNGFNYLVNWEICKDKRGGLGSQNIKSKNQALLASLEICKVAKERKMLLGQDLSLKLTMSGVTFVMQMKRSAESVGSNGRISART